MTLGFMLYTVSISTSVNSFGVFLSSSRDLSYIKPKETRVTGGGTTRRGKKKGSLIMRQPDFMTPGVRRNPSRLRHGGIGRPTCGPLYLSPRVLHLYPVDNKGLVLRLTTTDPRVSPRYDIGESRVLTHTGSRKR